MSLPRLLTRDFVLLVAAHFLQALGYASMLLLPLYLQRLGASRTQIGLLMATAAVSGLVMRPLVGWALDTIGRKPTLVVGTLLVVAGMVMIAGVDRIGPLVYLERVVFGVGVGTLFSGYFTFAADLVPAERRTEGLALFGVSGLVPLMVNPLYDQLGVAPVALRWFLPLVGGLIALSLIPLSLVPEPPRDAAAPRFEVRAALGALARRPLWPVWWATAAFSLLVAVFMTFATVVAERRGVARPATLWLTYALGAVVVRVIGGRVPDRLGPHNLVTPALGMYVGGCFVVAGATGLGGFALAGLLAGIGHGYAFPVLTAQMVGRVPGTFRGSAMTTFTALWGASELVGSPVFGALADRHGDAAMFGVAGLSGIVALVGWVVLEHLLGPPAVFAPRDPVG